MKINSIRPTEAAPPSDSSRSLGLQNAKPLEAFAAPKRPVPVRMITTEAKLPGFEIESQLGVVEGVAEASMPGVKVPHLELHTGGKLKELVEPARKNVAEAAAELGADAIIGFRYVFSGREYEKSVLAFGTAVTCRKLVQNANPSGNATNSYTRDE